MDRNCYRCGAAVEENAVFCPACRAGQIRVTRPAVDPEAADAQPGFVTPPLVLEHGRVKGPETVLWRLFLRTALPFAALTGFISSLFFPVVLLLFPLTYRRTLSQYRPIHAAPIRPGTGARLGAAMGLLSFVFFVPFCALAFYLGRDSLVARIRDMAAQNPDPQAQQFLLWCTTDAGFIVTSFVMLGFFLVLFLFIGLLCGALMTGQSENPR